MMRIWVLSGTEVAASFLLDARLLGEKHGAHRGVHRRCSPLRKREGDTRLPGATSSTPQLRC